MRVKPHKTFGWVVEANLVELPVFGRKAQAIKVAVAIAVATQPSQVVIHKRNMQIEAERTYQADPKRRVG